MIFGPAFLLMSLPVTPFHSPSNVHPSPIVLRHAACTAIVESKQKCGRARVPQHTHLISHSKLCICYGWLQRVKVDPQESNLHFRPAGEKEMKIHRSAIGTPSPQSALLRVVGQSDGRRCGSNFPYQMLRAVCAWIALSN